jgi:transcriptional regulator with PAS, ATPase and Fis domain
VRGVRYVVHRGPLVDRGVTSGSVLTFQESRAVERLDRALRSQPNTQQFAARYTLDDVIGASAPMRACATSCAATRNPTRPCWCSAKAAPARR